MTRGVTAAACAKPCSSPPAAGLRRLVEKEKPLCVCPTSWCIHESAPRIGAFWRRGDRLVCGLVSRLHLAVSSGGGTITSMPLREDNHYVSCGYLKRWASSAGRIWTYRILVSHPQVPLWKQTSPQGVAYHSHLYTQVVDGQATDEIERWLDSAFEAPATEALQKATSDERLTPDDWKRLVRFLAAQDMRTPARFADQVRHWNANLPSLTKAAVRNSIQILEEAAQSGQPLPQSTPVNSDSIPFRIITKREPGQDMVQLGQRFSWAVSFGCGAFDARSNRP